MTQTVAHYFYPVSQHKLQLYRASVLDAYPQLNYAIFTRRGGYSQTPFDTLNLSVSVGDEPDTVRENLSKACQALAISPEQTVSCHLIHSADVLTITPTNRQAVMGQADGLITADPGIYLAMRFGDCTPLIFFDPVTGLIGLTHAGWRGTLKNAAGATIQTMRERFGAQAKNIIALIGPAIGPCCYEVGPEVMAAARQVFNEADTLFTQRNSQTSRTHFDLWEANRRQLAAAGVQQIIVSGLCTACRIDEFFSHRAERGRTGRFGVIIGLRGAAG
jgi:purine-nucleoside/S-methyl-5'-thioadenosine phosphorylase / adenosine deaminase